MALSAPSRRRSGEWGRTSGFIDVSSEDISRVRGNLRNLKRDIVREQRRANRAVAKDVETWARNAARGEGGIDRRSANAIKGRGDARRARLQIVPGKRSPMAAVAFWGAYKRTGWYARYRYRENTAAQHRRWVGASWKAGVRGEGPYVINDVLADRRDEIQEMYVEAHEQVVAKALEVRRRA